MSIKNLHGKDYFTFSLLLSLLLLLVLAGALYSAEPSDGKINFSLKDQDGKEVRLSDLRGKIIVLEWLNPDCPFTQRHYAPETRTIVKLVEQYKDKDVVFLSINSTNYFDQAQNKAWHDKQQLKHQILDDHDGKIGKLFQAKTSPHIFIIDKDGDLAYQGAIDDNPYGDKSPDKIVNYVSQTVDELLAGKKPSITQTKPYGCSVKYAK